MTTTAIDNVHVWRPDGTILKNSQILIENGKIHWIGAPQPHQAATVVDADGATAYPGLFAALTTLGITGRPGQHDDATEQGPCWPELDTIHGLNSNDETIAVSRMEGITGAMSAGGFTSIFGGTGAAVHLSDNVSHNAISPRALQLINLEYELPVPTVLDYMSQSKASGPTTPGGVFAFVRSSLLSAKQQTAGESPRVKALREIADGDIRVMFMTNEQVGIRQALQLIKEFSLKAVLHAKADIVPFAAEIAELGLPVVWDGTSAPPRAGEPFDKNYSAAAALAEAGVDFCIGVPNWGPWRDTSSRPASHMVRTIPQCAAQAVAYGLDEDQALRSISVDAARIITGGVHGDLSIGSCADFALWQGSPLQLSSRVSAVYIQGEPIKMESFQTQLRDQYSIDYQTGI